jgi:aminoglycoside phosphotransferase (APT) family kinase protein
MSVLTDVNSGTTPVRDGTRFDEASLAVWMNTHVNGFRGPITIEQFKGGQSNPTYRLRTPAGEYVPRRKPPGPLLKGAHAIDREVKVLSGLANAGYPVPRIYGLCSESNVIGTPFYVMEMVEGRIFLDATLPEVAHDDRAAYFLTR